MSTFVPWRWFANPLPHSNTERFYRGLPMKTIFKFKFLLATLILSLAASATASEFIYKPASSTVAAVNLQKVEGGHLERLKKPFQIQRVRRQH